LVITRDIQAEIESKREAAFLNETYNTLVNQTFEGIDIIELKGVDQKTGRFDSEILLRNDTMKRILGGSSNPLVDIDDIMKMTPESMTNGVKTTE